MLFLGRFALHCEVQASPLPSSLAHYERTPFPEDPISPLQIQIWILPTFCTLPLQFPGLETLSCNPG